MSEEPGNKLTFKPASFSKDAALKAAREKASAAKAANTAAITKYLPATECKDRLGLIFDDSGSMSSHIDHVKQAHVEFFKNCTPNQTAAWVRMLCASNPILEKLNSNLVELAQLVTDAKVGLGGTPLFTKMLEGIKAEPSINRMIVFTDGSPTDKLLPYDKYPAPGANEVEGAIGIYYRTDADTIIEQAIEKKIVIDTIFFGSESYHSREIALLKYFAEKTGGYFMVFDPSKVDFRKALKYLAPVNRLMLGDGDFRKELQDGKRS